MQDSGLMNVAYYKFDVDDTTGELDSNRPVPFRYVLCFIQFCGSGMIYSGSGSSFEFSELRIRIQAKVTDPCGSGTDLY